MVFGGLPGCGIWAQFGGLFFGLCAKLLCDRFTVCMAGKGWKWEAWPVLVVIMAILLCVLVSPTPLLPLL